MKPDLLYFYIPVHMCVNDVYLFSSIELKHFLVTRIICGGDHSFLLYSNEQVCVYG